VRTSAAAWHFHASGSFQCLVGDFVRKDIFFVALDGRFGSFVIHGPIPLPYVRSLDVLLKRELGLN
jgi:hypothetical protein